nr:hypothetical protein Iba_chr12dCG15200 [Ipomoea batatas]
MQNAPSEQIDGIAGIRARVGRFRLPDERDKLPFLQSSLTTIRKLGFSVIETKKNMIRHKGVYSMKTNPNQKSKRKGKRTKRQKCKGKLSERRFSSGVPEYVSLFCLGPILRKALNGLWRRDGLSFSGGSGRSLIHIAQGFPRDEFS